MSDVMAYGLNFVFGREFIEKEYGAQKVDQMLAKLTPAEAAIWREAELEKAYPFAAFKHGVNGLTEALGSVETLELSRLYSHIASRSLSSVYKAFFRLTSPIFVIKNYPRLWQRFFDSGTVEVSDAESNHATVTFTLPEIFLDWLPPACLGYSQKAVDMAGGRYFAMRPLTKTQVDGQTWQVAYRLSWQ